MVQVNFEAAVRNQWYWQHYLVQRAWTTQVYSCEEPVLAAIAIHFPIKIDWYEVTFHSIRKHQSQMTSQWLDHWLLAHRYNVLLDIYYLWLALLPHKSLSFCIIVVKTRSLGFWLKVISTLTKPGLSRSHASYSIPRLLVPLPLNSSFIVSRGQTQLACAAQGRPNLHTCRSIITLSTYWHHEEG